MPVESDSDRAAFLDSDEFGASATWNSTTFDVMFLSKYELAAIFDVEIEANEVSAICRDSDISGIQREQTFTVNSTAYKVKDIQPDGTGMTTLILSED